MGFYALPIAFAAAYLLIGWIKQNAEHWGLVDIPNDRSMHEKQIARGAGIGFYLAAMFGILLYDYHLVVDYAWSFTAIFMIFFVGLLDDHNDTSPNTKFVVMMLATLFLYFDNIVIDELGVYWGIPLALGWLALPFTIFAVSGFTNAMNLIDGLDGLAGSVSMVILGGFWLIGYTHHDMFMVAVASFFMVTLAAFLVYNWHPASIFMGDSGSLTLGFVISLLAIKSLSYLPTASILFLTGVPILDTLVVMIRRKRNGRSVFTADRCHMHHVLHRFFSGNTRITVLFLGVLQAVYTIGGMQIDKEADEGYLLILFLLNVWLFYLLLNAMIKRQNMSC